MNVRLFYLSGLFCGLLVCAAASFAADGMDYDGDGRISEEEFRNYTAKEAALADTNGNGILDRSEYELSNAEAAAMDANKDGAIQLAEFQASLMEAFKRMDKNGDGYLDAGERRAR
jgi:Ca2+-binding EF-hand superfamily protein